MMIPFLVVTLCYALGILQARAQSYGPPSIDCYGTLYSYSSTALDSSGTMADTYVDPYGYSYVYVDANLNLFTQWAQLGTYNPATQLFNVPANSNIAAVGADGVSFLSLPVGVVVREYNSSYFRDSSGRYPDYSFWAADGSNIAKFLNVPAGDCFEINSSPWYQFAGGSDMLIDGTSGNWPSGIFGAPPQAVYLNGQTYYLQTDNAAGGVQYISENLVYSNWQTQDTAGIDRYFTSGAITGDLWGTVNGTYFTTGFDPATSQISPTGVPANFVVSLSAPSGYPNQGPPNVSWNGFLLPFEYTDANNIDRYVYSDGTNNLQVLIDSNDGVSVSGLYTTTGTYSPSTYLFDFGGDPNMKNFFAMDAYGNPLGLPAGVTLLFGSNTSGQAVLQANGVTATPSYTFQQPYGSWGVKYVGLPDGAFLVQDSNQAFTSPLYSYQAAQGDLVIYASGGWQPTNAFPSQLVINGVVCNLNTASETDSGGAPPGRSGSAMYYDQANIVSATLSWTWNAQFQGALQISYGGTGSYTGTWDGAVTFGGFPSGFTIGTTMSSGSPSTGPAQISMNGVPFKFVPSASGWNNAQYADIYQSASGMQISISPNGAVTLTRRDGSQVFGTYNPATDQFDFGGQGIGIVAATDTDGQALNTTISGGASTAFSGNLDVQGNVFSLGSWSGSGSNAMSALTFSYTDEADGQPALMNFDVAVSSVGWSWSHSVSDGSESLATVLTLDASNRLLLYAPGGSTTPNIILDPAGASGFHGPVRITPQGGLPMGTTFQSGPTPP